MTPCLVKVKASLHCAMCNVMRLECRVRTLARLATVMSFNYAVTETRQSIPLNSRL